MYTTVCAHCSSFVTLYIQTRCTSPQITTCGAAIPRGQCNEQMLVVVHNKQGKEKYESRRTKN